MIMLLYLLILNINLFYYQFFLNIHIIYNLKLIILYDSVRRILYYGNLTCLEGEEEGLALLLTLSAKPPERGHDRRAFLLPPFLGELSELLSAVQRRGRSPRVAVSVVAVASFLFAAAIPTKVVRQQRFPLLR